LAKVCARDEESAKRWVAIGARAQAVGVVGNLKFDLALGDHAQGYAALFAAEASRPLLLAASTHEGEEALVLEAFAKVSASNPGLRLLVAPRHPERAPAVLDLSRARGWKAMAWSDIASGAAVSRWPESRDVVVLDRLGLLRSAYASAAVTFVGGSLVAGPGGHNLLEAVVAGCPVVTGAFLGNVQDQVELLCEAGALQQVSDINGLTRCWLQVLADTAIWGCRMEAAQALLGRRRGALSRTVEALEALLDGSDGGRLP
jgi:3-deoxy-D-manno-octulosonic-acid transferase